MVEKYEYGSPQWVKHAEKIIKDLVKDRSTKMLMVFAGVFGLCWGMKDGWIPSVEGTYGLIIIVIFGIIARLIQDLKCENVEFICEERDDSAKTDEVVKSDTVKSLN